MISLHPFLVFCDWWFENNALAIESKGRKKQKWMLAMNVHIILLQAYFHIYLSLNSKQNSFIALQTRDFLLKKLKGKFCHHGDYFFGEWTKKKNCFLSFPNHQNFINFNKNLHIFVLSSPRKQTILLSCFVHSLICLMSGCHFSYITNIEKF